MSQLSLGAINKLTGEYVYPKIANKKEKNQIRYVSYTRAKQNLFIVYEIINNNIVEEYTDTA